MTDRPVLKATVRKARTSSCKHGLCAHVHDLWDVWYWWHWTDQMDVAGRDLFDDWDTALRIAVGTVERSNRAE